MAVAWLSYISRDPDAQALGIQQNPDDRKAHTL